MDANEIMKALVWMAVAADEDCPSHCRTDDFNDALQNAMEIISKYKCPRMEEKDNA